MGETTHQIGAKRPTDESTQGETTHGRNDPLPVIRLVVSSPSLVTS